MDVDSITRVRRFNRAVTTEAGALDGSFLGRGRPLGEARVLCRIGVQGCDVAALRRDLGLDSGLMSRLVRSLEGQGLIRLARDRTDARRRVARPTDAGRAEIAAYDALSDDRAAALLDRQSARDRAALLEAMDRIACVLNRDRIDIGTEDPETDDARACLQSYYDTLTASFGVTFDPATSRDPDRDALRAPRGTFLIARSDGMPVGCCALQGDGSRTGEVKRLWVSPAARGLGLATRLMNAAEDHARSLGMTLLRLDTNRTLTAAIAMYRAQGWQEIPAFNDEPYAHHWFEKTIQPGDP